MTTRPLQTRRGVLPTLAACLLVASTVCAEGANGPACDLYAPSTDAGAGERSQGDLYVPTADTEAPAAGWRADLYAPKQDAEALASSSQEVWKGDLYAPVEHATDPAKASANGCKADLYAPILDGCGPTRGRVTSDALSDGNGLALYQSSERLPKGDCIGGLYSVSASAVGPSRLALPAAGLSGTPTSPLYSPSLGGFDSPLMAGADHASLADGNMWDAGIAMPGVRGRQLGMIRGAVYSGDVDTLTLLYDLAPAAEAEPEADPALEPPRELSKVSLPIYRVKPPDTLQLVAVKLIPRPPYFISTYDVLQINVSGTIREQPINNYFLVEGDGIVSLGAAYGPVRVVGMTIEQAKAEITQHLQTILQRPAVTVQLARSEGTQQIAGMYQIGPDGTINLGNYGNVHVSGKTIAEVRVAAEQQLARFFDGPQVMVDVVGYHSESYYVIVAGASIGESVQRFGMTGNETVLDAISQMQGLSHISSKTMWVARATPGGMMCNEILPVDWVAITRGARTDTNYQILPGDRIYIVDDKLVTSDNMLTRYLSPVQRALGITQLGSNAIRNTQVLGRSYNQNRRY